jgi:glycogen phosphorylase
VKEIIDMIKNGFFSSGKQDVFYPIFDSLMNRGDYYMHLADFSSYIKTQNEVSQLFPDRDNWIRKSILNTANMGKFSSDRTIMEYAREIWKILPKK